MKKLFFIVAIAALLFSCQKELEYESTQQKAGLSFAASIENLATPTKAEINDDYDLLWSSGDMIGIFVNDGSWADKNQPFTLDGTGGDVTGKFNWNYGTFENENANAAYFPWNDNFNDDNHISDGRFYIKLPEHYGSDSDPIYTSGMMLTPLVAPVAWNGSGYNAIAFKHAGAAVKLTINNLPLGAHSIGLTANQPIFGYFNIAVADAGNADMVENAANVNYGNNTCFLHFSPSSSGEFTFLFPVPALTNPTLSFNLYDKNDVKIWGRTASNQHSLGHGDLLAMPALTITPYAKYTEVSSWGVRGVINGNTNWDDALYEMVTDNSNASIAKGITFAAGDEFKVTDGTDWYPGSNYSVGTAGTYDVIYLHASHEVKLVPTGEIDYPKVPHHTKITGATELGTTETANCYVITAAGSYKIPVVKGNSSESAGTRASVQLLWETYNTTGEVTPNSVIEAVDYDDDDNYVYFKTPDTLKPGNALIAAKDAEGNIIWSWHIWIPSTAITDIANGDFYNRKVMDRNLGALEAVADAASAPAMSTYGLYYQWGRKDPMFPNNWGTTSNLSYQGYSGAGVSVTINESIKNPTTYYYDGSDAEPKYCYWESSDNTELWKDSEKTIYDPCPAGYRVPKYDSSLAMWHYNVADGWTSDATNGWFKYGNITFPYAGYASGATHNYGGLRTVIWSSKYNSSERSYAAYLRSDKTPIYNYNSYYKAYLASVRCSMIDGVVKPEVNPLTPVSITIDGDMSEWASVSGTSTPSNVCREMKVMNDADNFYFYLKSVPGSRGSQLWGENAGYYYIDFDLDDDSETGDSEGSRTGFEAFSYLFLFGGTADAPVIVANPNGSGTHMSISNILAKGVIGSEYIEIELSIPRSNLPSAVTTGQIIRILTWRSKDGTEIEQRYAVL